MKITKVFRTFALIALVSGCSSHSPHHNRTGFLSSSAAERADTKETRWFKTMEGVDLSRYEKILVPEIRVLPNTKTHTAREYVLYAQISSYATAAYRQNIMQNSANYTLVDVPQADAILLQIAISMVEVHPDDKDWDDMSALAFSLNPQTYTAYQEGDARLLIEARISDAVSGKLLAQSARIVMEEEVRLHAEQLQFQDLQAGLNRWLNEAVVRH
jgi:uncharacterized protein YceK